MPPLEIIGGLLLRFRYAFEILLGGFLFVLPRKRRKWMPLFLPLGILVMGIISYFWNYEYASNIGFTILHYLFLALCMLLTLYASFDISIWDALFYGTGALAMQHITSILYGFIGNAYTADNQFRWDIYLYQSLVVIALYTLFYFFFIRKVRGLDVKQEPTLLIVNVIILAAAIVLAQLSKKAEGTLEVVIKIYDILVTGLSFFFLFYSQMKKQQETKALLEKQLYEEKEKQYESLAESVKTINLKCHDLRHQLRLASTEKGQKNVKDYLESVTSSIDVYDSYIRTGNDTLDVLLMQEKLLCNGKKIPFLISADASSLTFLSQSEICSLFGNLLENAIQYLSTIEPEKRYLSLSISKKGDFLSIREENYLDKPLQMKDGLPVTTKEDKSVHGFGTKSIQTIVENHSGGLSITGENHLFTLSILFPLTNN